MKKEMRHTDGHAVRPCAHMHLRAHKRIRRCTRTYGRIAMFACFFCVVCNVGHWISGTELCGLEYNAHRPGVAGWRGREQRARLLRARGCNVRVHAQCARA